ncbi:MAG: hypothetical protein WCP86_07690, partial [bacterium]
LWALNSMKLKMINAIRHYDGAFEMEFDDADTVSMAEIAAIASGDPLTLERFKLTSEVDTLYRQSRSFARRIDAATDSLDRANRLLEQGPGQIQKLIATSEAANTLLGNMSMQANDRSMKMGEKLFSSSSTARWALVQEIDRQKAGDEKATISIEIDGHDYTSKTAADDAIQEKLGDDEPFVAEFHGKPIIRRSDYARAMREVIGDTFADVEKTPVGTIYGLPITIDTRISVYGNYVTLQAFLPYGEEGKKERIAVDKDITPEKHKKGEPVAVSIMGLRPLISSFEAAIVHSANNSYSIQDIQNQMERATTDIPALETALTEKFKGESELTAKTERLREVETELEGRANAAGKAAQALLEPGLYRVTDDKGVREAKDRELSADALKELLAHGYTVKKAKAIDFSKYNFRNGPGGADVIDNGSSVEIESLPGMGFFVYKDYRDEWHVVEKTSGQPIAGRMSTKKGAIEKANTTAVREGFEKIVELVGKAALTDEQRKDAVEAFNAGSKNDGESASFLFGKRSTAGLPPISEGVVQSALDSLPFIHDQAGNARIVSVANTKELPVAVREEAAKRGIPDNEIHGALHNGYAYIVRENIKTQEDLEEVIFHEVLGHGGTRALLGDARKPFLLEQFHRAGGVTGLRQIAKLYGAMGSVQPVCLCQLQRPDGSAAGWIGR